MGLSRMAHHLQRAQDGLLLNDGEVAASSVFSAMGKAGAQREPGGVVPGRRHSGGLRVPILEGLPKPVTVCAVCAWRTADENDRPWRLGFDSLFFFFLGDSNSPSSMIVN